MTTIIRLLGRPEIRRDDEVVAVRGQKSWALLAVLVLRREPISRSRLAAMLFDRADDPLGALRWSLTQVRRALGADARVEGDPIALALGSDTVLDVDVLEGGTWVDALALPGLDDELLTGLTLDGNEAFDAWLVAERARVSGLAAGHLLDAALSELAAGRPQEAADVAARLVELQPLDEGHHELLVRALARAGQVREARDHVARATELLRDELGIDPSPQLAAAAETGSDRRERDRDRAPALGRAGVQAQLDAGEAAVAAGAVDAGLDVLRRAVREARDIDDAPLRIRTLTALGSALIHGVRGRDTEGAVTLHEAVEVGEHADLAPATAAAHRELAWVAVQQGRHHQALSWVERAAVLAAAAGDEPEAARILGVRALALDDAGQHGDAMVAIEESYERAAALGEQRQMAWARAMRARTHLQIGEYGEAEPHVHEALELTRRENWNAFLPYPETQLAELQRRAGDEERAVENLEHAFTLACHIGDPCWEALAGQGLAETEAARGHVDAAVTRLHDARARSARHPDVYRWVVGQVLGAMCEIGVRNELPATRHWIDDLEALALSAGLPDLVVGAHLHRAELGDTGALAAAALLAQDLDNPRFAHMREITPVLVVDNPELSVSVPVDRVTAARFRSQLLTGPRPSEPLAVVERLLAVQAQDPRGAPGSRSGPAREGSAPTPSTARSPRTARSSSRG